MTPTPSITTRLDSGRLRAAGLALAVLLGELVLAGAVVEPGLSKLLVLLAAMAGLTFAFVLPFATACIFLALGASVLYDSYFTFRVGVQFTLPQVVLAALLLVALVRPRRETWGGAAGGALLAFLGVIVVATFTAVSAGRVDLHTAVNSARPFFLLSFYWVVVRLFPEPERARNLLVAAAVLAAGTGVVEFATSVAGSVSSPLQDPGRQLITDNAGLGGLLRVRLPGVALAYGLFWWIASQALVDGRRKTLWSLALAATTVCIVISFNRNMWVGLVLGLALVIVAAGERTRRRLTAALVAATAGIALLVIAGPQVVGPTSALAPLIQRGSTLLSPGRELQDSSLQSRGHETTVAWQAVRHKLGLGLGPGAEFGVFYNENLGGGRYQRVSQTFLHNQYLFLVVTGGVGALIALLAYLVSVLRTAWRARRRDAAFGTLLTGVVMTMLSAVVMLSFTDPAFLVLLALVGGVVGVFAAAEEPA